MKPAEQSTRKGLKEIERLIPDSVEQVKRTAAKEAIAQKARLPF
jgi:hypothetical protein